MSRRENLRGFLKRKRKRKKRIKRKKKKKKIKKKLQCHRHRILKGLREERYRNTDVIHTHTYDTRINN